MAASTPAQRKTYTTVQNLQRCANALREMPYGALMHFPAVDTTMTPARAVQELAEVLETIRDTLKVLETIRDTLKGVASRSNADKAELDRLRGVMNGARAFLAELQPTVTVSLDN